MRCLQFGAVVNNAAMNILVHVFGGDMSDSPSYSSLGLIKMSSHLFSCLIWSNPHSYIN